MPTSPRRRPADAILRLPLDRQQRLFLTGAVVLWCVAACFMAALINRDYFGADQSLGPTAGVVLLDDAPHPPPLRGEVVGIHRLDPSCVLFGATAPLVTLRAAAPQRVRLWSSAGTLVPYLPTAEGGAACDARPNERNPLVVDLSPGDHPVWAAVRNERWSNGRPQAPLRLRYELHIDARTPPQIVADLRDLRSEGAYQRCLDEAPRIPQTAEILEALFDCAVEGGDPQLSSFELCRRARALSPESPFAERCGLRRRLDGSTVGRDR